MNGQESNEFRSDDLFGQTEDWQVGQTGGTDPAHEAEATYSSFVDGEYRYKPVHRHEEYTDAHFERADASTVPPRYYTPHEKTMREERPRQRKRSSNRRPGAVLCMILLSGLLGGFCGSALTQYRLGSRIDALEAGFSEQEAAIEKAAARQPTAVLAQTDGAAAYAAGLSPSYIYEQATQQVVGIRTEVTMTNFFGMTSSGAVSGSGFIISKDGYIMTNYHVVENAYERNLEIQVMTYDRTTYAAEIVGVEPANDVAVLKIDAEGLNAAILGDSDSIFVGDTVYAVGNPLGELEFSMSTGHVSALDRVINTQESEAVNMFQIDAAVNSGNSGGPVYDRNGNVIGIVTAKYSSSGVEGLGFAIPINDAKKISDDLINKGYVSGKAFMGVTLESRYNAMYSQYYGMPLGAYVSDVTPASAADQAGLQKGDIITAIGGYPVEGYDDVKTVLRHFSAFETTEMTVFRTGDELKITITFDEMKPE